MKPIETISRLSEDLQQKLLSFVRKCTLCGKTIVGNANTKMCCVCAEKKRKQDKLEYYNKNFSSVHYQHDSYISHRKRHVLALALLIPASSISAPTSAPEDTIDYPALFNAIAQVESDNGKTSDNKYQIKWNYVYDLERITGLEWDYMRTISSDMYARLAMRTYWNHYAPKVAKGKPVTAELLAKIHRVGPTGLKTKKREANAYWTKVKKHYAKFSKAKL